MPAFLAHPLAVMAVAQPTMRAAVTHLMALMITAAGIYDMLVNKATSGPLIDLTYAVVVGYIGIHGVAVGTKVTGTIDGEESPRSG